MTQTLRATRIGARADARLHESGRWWAVLASVSGAIYIEDVEEELLWIAASSTALHPRAIVLPALPPVLPHVGTECEGGGGHLRVGGSFNIDLREAEVWRPRLTREDDLRVMDFPCRVTRAITRVARQTTLRGALARVVLVGPAGSSPGVQEATERELVAAAEGGVTSLCQVSSASGLPAALHEATALVGLGAGLTPSGDDLLGAFLFVLRTFGLALPNLNVIDWRHVEKWLRRIGDRTNKISFSVLADHAHGEATASLTGLVYEALEGSSEERLVQLADQVARIGHSSGWDMLAGVHCACLALERILGNAYAGRRDAAERCRMGWRSQCWKEVARVC